MKVGNIQSVFAVFSYRAGKINVIVTDGLEKKNFTIPIKKNASEEDALMAWAARFQKRQKMKIIAAGVLNFPNEKRTATRLWLEGDIVGILPESKWKNDATFLRNVFSRFKKSGLSRVRIGDDRKVHPEFLVRLKDYFSYFPREKHNLLKDVIGMHEKAGLRVNFINSTSNGGGVALMRHSMIRFFKEAGVQAGWYVMDANQEVFTVTKKKFHNILQGVAQPDLALNANDKKIYEKWIRHSKKRLASVFANSDVIVIDDPQPSGLIPHIRKRYPNVKIIYRSHIQIDSSLIKERKQQETTWRYLWKNIRDADIFVSHPIPSFVPAGVPKKKVVFMPATTDPLDGLNKKLADEHKKYYWQMFNDCLAESNQSPLAKTRPYIIQVSRFDPSKGIPDVIESYRLLREKCAKKKIPQRRIPQLVIAGNGSADDPEGVSVYESIMNILAMDNYRHLATDVKVAQLPHYDQLLNTMLSDAAIVLQLSHKEGFEVKVTEAAFKGRPVIAYRTGGIPLQIKNNKTGFLIPSHGTTEVAEKMFTLLEDAKLAAKISKRARKEVQLEYFTPYNAAKWLYLSLFLTKKVRRNGFTANEGLKKYFKIK